jgi:Replication protein
MTDIMSHAHDTLPDPMCCVAQPFTLGSTPRIVPPETDLEDPYAPLTDAHADRWSPTPASAAAANFRHSHWAALRERTRRAMVQARFGFRRRYAFQACGGGAQVKIDTASGQVRSCATTCHDRWCAPCGARRRQKLATALRPLVQKSKTLHVVLTERSTSNGLDAGITHLMHSLGQLRRQRWWKDRVDGGAWFLEMTHNGQTRQWHPHLHLLVHASWLELQELIECWKQASGGSNRVDVSLVRHTEAALVEVTKYQGKLVHRSWAHDPHLIVEAMESLDGRRIASTFGSWRGTCLQPDAPDDPNAHWVTIGDLDGVLARAAAGDADAEYLLAVLRGTAPVDVQKSRKIASESRAESG